MPGSETEAAGLLDRYLSAAADAVGAAGESTRAQENRGKTSAVREGVQRSQADDGQNQLRIDPVP
jgi:hypothetical protein